MRKRAMQKHVTNSPPIRHEIVEERVAKPDAGLLAEVDAVLATLPKLDCQKRCQACCSAISMSSIEWDRIRNFLQCSPRAVRLFDPCPMLNQSTGRCTVYAIRPAICRIWGLVEKLACPFGCKPERYLTDEEAAIIFGKIGEIAARYELKKGENL